MFITAVVLIFTTTAGANVPNWFSSPPSHDSQYYYFAGVGEAFSIQEAREQAEAACFQDLALSFFGAEGFATQQVKGNNSKLDIQTQAVFQSNEVFVKNFETVKQEVIQGDDGSVTVYILKKLSIKDAEKILAEIQKSESDKGRPLSNLTIDSNPPDADIKIGSRNYGKAPLRALLPPGFYKISLTRTGYRDTMRTIQLRPGHDEYVTIQMTGKRGTLKIATNVSGAQISINGTPVLKGSSFTVELNEGTYEIAVKANGYQDFVKKVSVGIGRTVVVQARLQKSEANPKAGCEGITDQQFAKLDFDTQMDVTRCLYDQNQVSQTIRLVNYAIKVTSNQTKLAQLYYFKGMVFTKIGQHDIAVRELSKATVLDHQEYLFPLALCLAQFRAKKFDLAVAACDQAIRRDPDVEMIYAIRAHAITEQVNEKIVVSYRDLQAIIDAHRLRERFKSGRVLAVLTKLCRRQKFQVLEQCWAGR